MQTTVTTKNMASIPAELSRKMGITPGCRIDWQQVEEGGDTVTVRVLPKRGDLARRLLDAGRKWSPERDAVAGLVAERLREDEEARLS